MGNAYKLKMMPLAEQRYCFLRSQTDRLPGQTTSEFLQSLKSQRLHLEHVETILRSLQNPRDAYLDQPLLERMSFLLTRSIDSTLVYYRRIEIPVRCVSVLIITECDSTNAYVRFCAFMNAGGHRILEKLGVHVPIGSIGSSAMVQ
jgi:hypothetical protein